MKQINELALKISIYMVMFFAVLGVIFIISIFTTESNNSDETDALRYELKKLGAYKEYSDQDYDIVYDQCKYMFVDPHLVWGIIRAENARRIALGGILTPISDEIRKNILPEKWPHFQLVKSIHHYQLKFLRHNPELLAKYAKQHKRKFTVDFYNDFFWTYRTLFIDEFAVDWLAPGHHSTVFKRNVLILWKQSREGGEKK